MRYTSLCAIARDEDLDIQEWVDYHLRLGFEHVYLFDNRSRNPLDRLLAAHTARGLLTIIPFEHPANPQLAAYAACLRAFGATTAWMAFLDIDEFLVPKQHTDIRDVLDGYTGYGGLAVHWKIFGSGGHKRRPAGPVTRNYTVCLNPSTHIKSIVRPERVRAVRSPHHFLYRDGAWCVNEDRVPVLTHHSYHTSRTIQINHYYYKSFEDFQRKMERGLATPAVDGRKERDPRELEAFARQALIDEPRDTAIFAILEAQAKGMDSLLPETRKRPAAKRHPTPAEDIVALQGPGERERTMKEPPEDEPAAWLAQARALIRARRAGEALARISCVLRDLESPLRTEAYALLAEYYRLTGEPRTAEAIERELHD